MRGGGVDNGKERRDAAEKYVWLGKGVEQGVPQNMTVARRIKCRF